MEQYELDHLLFYTIAHFRKTLSPIALKYVKKNNFSAMQVDVEVLCHEKEGKQHAYTKTGSNVMTPFLALFLSDNYFNSSVACGTMDVISEPMATPF